MVTTQERALPTLLAALREGLKSLTVTGPSPVLEVIYREALRAVRYRLSQQEREKALNRAWRASSAASSLAVSEPAVMKAMDEMYFQVRLAISASRPE
jgi:hypothetical protein